MTHGQDVMAQVRPNADGGIPWFAVLDEKGKPLATSHGPKGNIGFPFTPEEIDHFMVLIAGQSRRIDAGQQDQLRQSLVASADRITKEKTARQAAPAVKAQ